MQRPETLFKQTSVTVTQERTYYLKICLLYYLIWIVLFEVIGNYAATLPTHDLTTAIDRKIPVIPAFVWVYTLCYVTPLLPIILIKDWHRFNRALLAYLLACLSAFLIYLTFPIAYPRPELGHSLSERLLAFEYRYDFQPGANKLPSLHVATAWIVYLACRRQRLNRFGDALLLGLALLISASTLFVKQHLVIDVAAGIVWSFTAWKVASWLYPRLTDPSLAAPAALKHAAKKVVLLLTVFGIALLFAATVHSGQGV